MKFVRYYLNFPNAWVFNLVSMKILTYGLKSMLMDKLFVTVFTDSIKSNQTILTANSRCKLKSINLMLRCRFWSLWKCEVKLHLNETYQSQSIENVNEHCQDLSVEVGRDEGAKGPEEYDHRHDDGQILPCLGFGSRVGHELSPIEPWNDSKETLNILPLGQWLWHSW